MGIYRCKVADAASLEVKVGQSVGCASLHAENNFELNCFWFTNWYAGSPKAKQFNGEGGRFSVSVVDVRARWAVPATADQRTSAALLAANRRTNYLPSVCSYVPRGTATVSVWTMWHSLYYRLRAVITLHQADAWYLPDCAFTAPANLRSAAEVSSNRRQLKTF